MARMEAMCAGEWQWRMPAPEREAAVTLVLEEERRSLTCPFVLRVRKESGRRRRRRSPVKMMLLPSMALSAAGHEQMAGGPWMVVAVARARSQLPSS